MTSIHVKRVFVFPLPLVVGQLVGGFVAIMASVSAGAWIYRSKKF